MTRKNVLRTCLVALLLFGMVMAKAVAQQTKIYVSPELSTIPGVGDVFTIKIKIAGVSNLTAFEFKLLWDRTLLNVTDTAYTVLDPSWTSPFWLPYSPDVPLNNEYNATHGLFWLGCVNFPVIPISGDFVLATLTFEVMSLGNSTLRLFETKLTDSKAEKISHQAIDGKVATLEQPASFPIETIAVVIVIAVFLVAALYYVKKKIL